jgi:hypothetical protein
MTIYADKATFLVNGKPLAYTGDAPEIMEGRPEITTVGQVGGAPVHTPDYSKAYSVITLQVVYSQENKKQLLEIENNKNNNTCSYRDQKFTGCILLPFAKSDGKTVSLTFHGNPYYA